MDSKYLIRDADGQLKWIELTPENLGVLKEALRNTPCRPLNKGERKHGTELWSAFREDMSEDMRSAFDSLGERDQEIVQGFVLGLLTGRGDLYLGIRPSDQAGFARAWEAATKSAPDIMRLAVDITRTAERHRYESETGLPAPVGSE
jgi:hypothetical protein